MKAKKGFNLRNVCGEQIIVAEGKENIDFSNIISMNEFSSVRALLLKTWPTSCLRNTMWSVIQPSQTVRRSHNSGLKQGLLKNN